MKPGGFWGIRVNWQAFVVLPAPLEVFRVHPQWPEVDFVFRSGGPKVPEAGGCGSVGLEGQLVYEAL